MSEAVARRIENKRDLSPHMLRMMFDEPFFARILRGVNTEFGRDIPTAGVMVKDGDVHMLVNPDFVSDLSDAHIRGCSSTSASTWPLNTAPRASSSRTGWPTWLLTWPSTLTFQRLSCRKAA